MKIKRFNFIVSDETNTLIRKIKQETGLSLTMIVEKAVELFAKEKGIKE